MVRGGQETQVVMLGGTRGSTHHAVVPPHCVESSSVASLPCGHKEKEERKDERTERERERFGMDRGHVPIISPAPVRIS